MACYNCGTKKACRTVLWNKIAKQIEGWFCSEDCAYCSSYGPAMTKYKIYPYNKVLSKLEKLIVPGMLFQHSGSRFLAIVSRIVRNPGKPKRIEVILFCDLQERNDTEDFLASVGQYEARTFFRNYESKKECLTLEEMLMHRCELIRDLGKTLHSKR